MVQRVRVRWSAAGRGARHADARRGLSKPVLLPDALPDGDVVVHEVLADEANGYVRRGEVLTGESTGLGLQFGGDEAALTVALLPWAVYPRREWPAKLFTLGPGQVGRYRANFRFLITRCCCNPSWYYEDWLVHVSNGSPRPDRFVHGKPHFAVDHRVHLYGGRARSGQ
ncbi:hypothetical protein [Actinoplanes aureus]|uniref:hypothetical protein n=1 Tax=Actinoplanes aureus TaxID=2792083 RepID=UPI002814EF03|nr:hypothetical protein [Actinoplanes aureus]